MSKKEEEVKTVETKVPLAPALTPEEEKIVVEKDVITEIPEEEAAKVEAREDVNAWKPKTTMGKNVKDGKITSIDEILEQGQRILEVQIVDALLPNMEAELLFVGQSKGKFGGGQKRIFRQTQKKTPEGNKPSFGCFAVVGNGDGYVGGGYGKSKDTVPAREKATRNAKMNIFKIRRGCGSWECHCGKPHSIPFAVHAKCGSSEITLIPAPRGKGLVIEEECAKILRLAGIRDVWSKTEGQTRVKTNLLVACLDALKKLMLFKIQAAAAQRVGLSEGRLKSEESHG